MASKKAGADSRRRVTRGTVTMPVYLLRRFVAVTREEGLRAAVRRAWRRVRGGAPPPENLAARTRAFWDDLAAREGETDAGPGRWTSHPLVRTYMNRQITGRGDQEWLPWARERFFTTRARRGLCLACGRGNEAREMVTEGLCQEVVGVDISSALLEIAERLTQRERVSRITYHALDLDHDPLPDGPFDLVVAKMALHHCTNLPHVFAEVWRVLRPGGGFLWNEYIGPSRFQWTPAQLHLMNGLLHALPERYRWRAFDGVLKPEIARPDPGQMPDPSEAACSAQISLVFARQPWEVLAQRPYGGTLLAELLAGIVENFAPDRTEDRAAVEALITIEQTLLQNGLLAHNYQVVVARKPP